jgi:hypothetical protein
LIAEPVLAGLLIGVAAWLLVPSVWWRMAVVTVAALLAGLATVVIAQGWLGISRARGS